MRQPFPAACKPQRSDRDRIERADPEALQYRESLTISAEDQEFIERVYEAEDPQEEVEATVEEV